MPEAVLPVGRPHPTGAAAQSGSSSPASGEGKPTSPLGGEVKDRVRVLSVLVEDGPNMLTKIAGAIRRRGFHVRGISVGPSRQRGRSRITLQIDHGHAEADQVRKQLERLVEVVEVEDLTGDDVHSRELVVAKVAAS
ncbi:MAG: acetolactate synthase small subunit, partial [Chloroflexi bacterium]